MDCPRLGPEAIKRYGPLLRLACGSGNILSVQVLTLGQSINLNSVLSLGYHCLERNLCLYSLVLQVIGGDCITYINSDQSITTNACYMKKNTANVSKCLRAKLRFLYQICHILFDVRYGSLSYPTYRTNIFRKLIILIAKRKKMLWLCIKKNMPI